MKSKRMTRQRSFNRFYKHFVVEKNPACIAEDDGMCKYRLEPDASWEPGDTGCGIGIQPEFQEIYHHGFEGVGIISLWNSQKAVQAIISKDDLDFFESLQMLHDNRRDAHDFETHHIPQFIREWKLNTPKPRKDKDNERSKNQT